MNTAVIYTRISTADNKHGGNRQDTDRQIADLTRYAEATGLTVTRIFDEHLSGYRKRAERPQLDECLKYCVANHVGTILLSELSRIGRDAEDILQNVLFCKQCGINVYFQKEQFSIFTADGKPHPFLMIFISILGTIAQMEGEAIKYRLQSGLRNYVEKGGKVGRKEGFRKTREDYERDYPRVFRELRKKDRLNITQIAKLCDVNRRTVLTCREFVEADAAAAQERAAKRRARQSASEKIDDTPTEQKD